jgi:hypothetical protein
VESTKVLPFKVTVPVPLVKVLLPVIWTSIGWKIFTGNHGFYMFYHQWPING